MMGDLGVGMMAWLNIIAIWILHKPAIQALKDYELQKKQLGSGKKAIYKPNHWQVSKQNGRQLISFCSIVNKQERCFFSFCYH